MNIKQKYGSTALIAGASEGLGAAYAHALASAGCDLVMIARRQEQLETTASTLRDTYKIRVHTIAVDLSSPTASQEIVSLLNGRDINFFVYNAAISHIGPFLSHPSAEHEKITTANMTTPMKLVHHFGNEMMKKGKGGIVLMTSMAALQGGGFIATYSATKAFNLILAESLWYEWRNKGVDIIACCAGATTTPNFLNTNPGKTGLIQPPLQSPEAVVRECLRKIGSTPSFVSGTTNKLASFFIHNVITRKLATIILGNTTRKMYRIKY
jgi:short-subunit dehydrogenase